jgi:hypothetical protein
MRKTHLACLFIFLMSSISVFAQKSIITGKVVDVSNEPLIGVNVLVKGTTNGTVTDIDGKYSISAPSGSTLSFTYVGFTPQLIKVTQNVINVT